MDLSHKLQIARAAIDSISRHDDEDAAVRKAMLDRIAQHVQDEQALIDQRVRDRLAELGAPKG